MWRLWETKCDQADTAGYVWASVIPCLSLPWATGGNQYINKTHTQMHGSLVWARVCHFASPHVTSSSLFVFTLIGRLVTVTYWLLQTHLHVGMHKKSDESYFLLFSLFLPFSLCFTWEAVTVSKLEGRGVVSLTLALRGTIAWVDVSSFHLTTGLLLTLTQYSLELTYCLTDYPSIG